MFNILPETFAYIYETTLGYNERQINCLLTDINTTYWLHLNPNYAEHFIYNKWSYTNIQSVEKSMLTLKKKTEQNKIYKHWWKCTFT